ncbi:anthranilate phosphoribosyltransferase [Bacillus sp. HMF5848]|uniref:anthranilate phosphoribosyltransferase n=1 Tax=Bacillus sp. HMF5848 TaxID=2495421 RepID=UPI000F7B5624|nr:anthranilate phosphoribosyltransferase [Bacillus sp. HMF5848]RSK27427.1 anthranilate phosphoribosyltransferase [Bacillus sp. HMF5848]
MFKQLLAKCIEGSSLTMEEAEALMHEIMEGRATESQIASLLSILRFRGETVDELIGFIKAMRMHMTPLTMDEANELVIDTCGTGGDGSSTFNISTAAAILVSSTGVKVAKHGNRAVSSKSGSADVLEYLGIDIQSSPEEAEIALKNHNMSFLFAPIYHSAMRHAVTPRKEIGFRTAFNLLGPLSNPANCKHQVIGVFSVDYARKLAEAMKHFGSEHVLFVTGRDGLDEISISAETNVVELKDGQITEYVITPDDFGFKRGKIEDVIVSSVEESARRIEAVFHNKATDSSRNIVILNAGAALYVAGRAADIQDGVYQALGALRNGTALKHFQSLQANGVSRRVN